jgi:hypothetical protein
MPILFFRPALTKRKPTLPLFVSLYFFYFFIVPHASHRFVIARDLSWRRLSPLMQLVILKPLGAFVAVAFVVANFNTKYDPYSSFYLHLFIFP